MKPVQGRALSGRHARRHGAGSHPRLGIKGLAMLFAPRARPPRSRASGHGERPGVDRAGFGRRATMPRADAWVRASPPEPIVDRRRIEAVDLGRYTDEAGFRLTPLAPTSAVAHRPTSPDDPVPHAHGATRRSATLAPPARSTPVSRRPTLLAVPPTAISSDARPSTGPFRRANRWW